jgi:hypothetical protein
MVREFADGQRMRVKGVLSCEINHCNTSCDFCRCFGGGEGWIMRVFLAAFVRGSGSCFL